MAGSGYTVGRSGVTRIEACTKSGMHADIPYVRVWKGEIAAAEFCQHQIQGVYFVNPTEPPKQPPADHVDDPRCMCTDCIPF